MISDAQIENLARLVAAKPELAATLQNTRTPDAVAAVLVKAAQENGLSVDEPALRALLAEQTAAGSAKLSDADLDQLAGGSAMGAVLMSLVTAGVICIAMSIFASNHKLDYKQYIHDQSP